MPKADIKVKLNSTLKALRAITAPYGRRRRRRQNVFCGGFRLNTVVGLTATLDDSINAVPRALSVKRFVVITRLERR